MDNSHVALVSLRLDADMFDPFRCDRNMVLGINIERWALQRIASTNTLPFLTAPMIVAFVTGCAESDSCGITQQTAMPWTVD